MMYDYPTTTRNVSDDFNDHVARKSVNPGTDYTAGYGSEVYSIADGIVTDADGDPGGSGGRMIHIDNDDGTGADYLHLSALSVSRGDRVRQGQRIGWSGGSGYGENRYYGAHLHISFRRRHGAAYTNSGNLDFDALMRSTSPAGGGNSTPITPTTTRKDYPDMRLIKVVQPTGTTYALVGTRYFQSTHDVAQANAWAETWGDAKTVSDRAWDEALNAAKL